MTTADWFSVAIAAVSIASMVVVYVWNRRANAAQLERLRREWR